MWEPFLALVGVVEVVEVVEMTGTGMQMPWMARALAPVARIERVTLLVLEAAFGRLIGGRRGNPQPKHWRTCVTW